MLQTSSSGVSLVAPNETAKTLYCSLSEINGEKKPALQDTILYQPWFGPHFCQTHHTVRGLLISLHEINEEWN